MNPPGQITRATLAIEWMQRLIQTLTDSGVGRPEALKQAGKAYCRTFPRTSASLLEEIGMHPSSEPELAAIQEAFFQ